MTELINFHLLAGWSGMLLGALTGAVMGIFFHREDWAGGYGSYSRRMMRLGHIAFFGIGMLNLLFGLSLPSISLSAAAMGVASKGLLTAAVAMPLVGLLTRPELLTLARATTARALLRGAALVEPKTAARWAITPSSQDIS